MAGLKLVVGTVLKRAGVTSELYESLTAPLLATTSECNHGWHDISYASDRHAVCHCLPTSVHLDSAVGLPQKKPT